jgi:rSAM/selenodomain-associated transferase 1
MSYSRKLGIFARIPASGHVKTRLVPPLSDEAARLLYTAFLSDLFARLEKLKKVAITVFYTGGNDPAPLRALAPDRFRFVAQEGGNLGERLENGFEHLLRGEGSVAVMLGSDSPDVPLTFVKRAFLKLKHKDVVLGPASDGGYYLIGLRERRPELFSGPVWSTDAVLEQTLEIIRDGRLSCSLLPLWYDVDDERSLALLRSMILGRRIERSDRLHHTERVMRQIAPRDPTKR